MRHSHQTYLYIDVYTCRTIKKKSRNIGHLWSITTKRNSFNLLPFRSVPCLRPLFQHWIKWSPRPTGISSCVFDHKPANHDKIALVAYNVRIPVLCTFHVFPLPSFLNYLCRSAIREDPLLLYLGTLLLSTGGGSSTRRRGTFWTWWRWITWIVLYYMMMIWTGKHNMTWWRDN